MSTLEIVFLVIVVAVLAAWYLSYTAARLHRLHTHVEGALAALDAQLVRRAEASVELANSGVIDPAGSLLLASAAGDSVEEGDTLTALDWVEGDLAVREAVETDLTRALREVLAPGGESLPTSGPAETPASASAAAMPVTYADVPAVQRVRGAHRRVQLARAFYNEAVHEVHRLRRNPAVRVFRLAGHATLPRTVEFDDDLP